MCEESDVQRGAFETVNDTVVGDGRRMVRYIPDVREIILKVYEEYELRAT